VYGTFLPLSLFDSLSAAIHLRFFILLFYSFAVVSNNRTTPPSLSSLFGNNSDQTATTVSLPTALLFFHLFSLFLVLCLLRFSILPAVRLPLAAGRDGLRAH
jgi:hypothetical protein